MCGHRDASDPLPAESSSEALLQTDNPRVAVETTAGDPGRLNSSSTRGAKLWNRLKKKYHLLEYHALPPHLQDNEYILKGYRPEFSLKEAVLSIFRLHNETGNIWTHLIGFFIFLGLTVYTFMNLPHVDMPHMPHIPTLTEIQHALQHIDLPHFTIPESLSACYHPDKDSHNCLFHLGEDVMTLLRPYLTRPTPPSPITRWPFFLFLIGAMTCLLTSSVCHLLGCQSKEVNSLVWRFDYAGIAALVATSFYPPVYYGFLCDPLPRTIYLTTITIMGFGAILVSLLDEFQQTQYRTFRACLFVGMGLCGVVPTAHKVLFYWMEPVVITTTLLEITMGLLYGLGAMFYTSRIPERWLPGKFDIAGHSHQIFHLLVIAGALTHYQSGMLYLEWRDREGCLGFA